MEKCYYCNSLLESGDWDGSLDTTNPLTYACGSTIEGNVFDQTEECERLEKIFNESRVSIKTSEYIDAMKVIDEALPMPDNLKPKRVEEPSSRIDPKHKVVYDLFDRISSLNRVIENDPVILRVRSKIEEAIKNNKKNTLQQAQTQISSFNHGNRN
jgi:Txe/YoeB family toxin of Txe-Axe toxin-antitoxin module